MSHSLRAAGCVLWREVMGVVEVALVHRPRYDDWSLPKGKLEPDEAPLLAAVREVGEETGARGVVGRRLGTLAYPVGSADKTVEFFAMRYLDGDFVPNDETDELAWVSLTRVQARMTYPDERAVVARFAAGVRPDATVVLVRHARAGKRSRWDGDDRLRPLDRIGRVQAERLARLIEPFAPDTVHSADRVRCEQTVAPLAARLALPIGTDPRFSDESVASDLLGGAAGLLQLAGAGARVVISSQGGAIPALLRHLAPQVPDTETRKATFWVLGLRGSLVVSADRYDDASRRRTRS